MADVLQKLKDLADEYVVRDARKLYQLAQRQGVDGATSELAKQALSSDIGRQILAPPPRATGKSAATRPDANLQADLIDFNNLPRTKEGNRYLAVVGDVFTREVRAVPLDSKDPVSVAAAMKPMIENIRDSTDGQFTLSTDAGAEFSRLGLPEGAAHRIKAGKQDIAVVDRQIQTLKKDLATRAARKGGEFDENIAGVVAAYNARPHSTTIVAPEDVELIPEAEFTQYQQNADKYMTNRAQSERRMSQVKESKTIRAPLVTQSRSFRPQYGDALKVRTVDSQFVTTTTGRQILTKEAQAIPADSAKSAVGQLTDPAFVKKQRLQGESLRLEAYLQTQPNGQVKIADLDRQLRTVLPAVKKGLLKARVSLRFFLRMFAGIFRVQRGIVSAVNLPAAPEAPAAPEPAAQPPRAETREERNARLDRLLAESRAKEDASKQARLARERERPSGLRRAFPERPR
jgi:hypothetical protein